MKITSVEALEAAVEAITRENYSDTISNIKNSPLYEGEVYMWCESIAHKVEIPVRLVMRDLDIEMQDIE